MLLLDRGLLMRYFSVAEIAKNGIYPSAVFEIIVHRIV